MKLTIPWLQKVTLVAICLFMALMWSGIGRDYLFDWDEGIYAVIGREMKASKNWLTPTWNGDLWLEKPPAIGWVTSLGLAVAGENELGARLFMPLFAGLTLYAIYRLGQKLGGTLMGSGSAALLGYFNLFLSRARSLNTDGMLLAAIAWVSWLLLAGSSPWLVGIVMGLAIMVKGASGVLAILIALPLLVKKSKKFIILVIGACLLVILPWHLYALIIHGWSFITPYLMEQVVRRATVPIEFHMESRWFYFQFLYSDLGIGVLLVALFGFVMLVRRWLASRTITWLFPLWWIALPLALFTLAKTRLSWYILPAYPGIALTIAYGLTCFINSHKTQAVLKVLVLGMLAQMLFHAYQYVAPGKPPSHLTPPLQVAQTLSAYPGDELAMLVSSSERTAEAILPKDQTISSSFRYGGAPSVVWYSHKHVLYYYNYDQFMVDASDNKNIAMLLVESADLDKVPPGFKQVTQGGNYLGFIREGVYALR